MARPGRNKEPLSDLLAQMGFVPAEVVVKARAANPPSDEALVQALVDRELVTEEQVAEARAKQAGLPYVDLKGTKIQPQVREMIDRKVQLAKKLVPIEVNDLFLTVAMANPGDVTTRMQLEQSTGRGLKVVVASWPRIKAVIWGHSQLKKDEDEEKEEELSLEVMLKVFDRQDRDLAPVVYGGMVRKLTSEGAVVDGSLPGGDTLRALAFRKLIFKMNLFLTGQEEPVRGVALLTNKGTPIGEEKNRFEIGFEKLAPGDEERLAAFLELASE